MLFIWVEVSVIVTAFSSYYAEEVGVSIVITIIACQIIADEEVFD